MRILNDEEKLIYEMANAMPYGVYCDVEVSPVDPDYSDGDMKCNYDDVSSSHPDDIFEWIEDYHDGTDNEYILAEFEKFRALESSSQKWDMILDWNDDYNKMIIFDALQFYHYRMERRLVGVCLTRDEAIILKNSIDKELKPCIDTLSRYELKGYSQLRRVADYFRNKAKEIF